MSQENVAVVRALFDAFGRDDLEASLALCDPDVEFSPLSAQLEGRVLRGHDAVCAWDAERRLTWQLELQADEFLDLDDRVLVHGSIRAMGLASGADVVTPVSWVLALRDAKVRSFLTFGDREAALRSVGLRE